MSCCSIWGAQRVPMDQLFASRIACAALPATKTTPGHPQGPRNSQNGAPRLPKWSPRGPQGSQKGTQETPGITKMEPERFQQRTETSTLPRSEIREALRAHMHCHNEPNPKGGGAAVCRREAFSIRCMPRDSSQADPNRKLLFLIPLSMHRARETNNRP